MKTATKIWLIIAAALTVIGAAVCAYAVSADGLPAAEYTTDTVEVTERFRSVTVRCDTEDIALLPSEDGKCRVTFTEPEQTAHSVTVQDGTLMIDTNDTRKWYEHLTLFSFGSPALTLSLPQGEYDLLSVAVSTGDIRVEHITAGTLDLSVSTGGTALTDVTCRELSSRGSTGDLTMEDVTAAGTITARRSTGDVRMSRCDAAALEITTDTGDVTGSLLTEKIFFAQSDTGSVHVPETATGGTCRITTDTGDISITVP